MLRLWDRIEVALAGVLGLAALIVGLVQVAGRYLDPQRAISYAEEVIVYLVVWAIMLISSQLARTDGHVRPDVVLRLLPLRVRRWVELFNCVVAIVFTAGLAWYGAEIVWTSYLIGERSASDLEFPMWLYYLALPVGGGLMLLRYAGRLVRLALGRDAAPLALGLAAGHEMLRADTPKPD